MALVLRIQVLNSFPQVTFNPKHNHHEAPPSCFPCHCGHRLCRGPRNPSPGYMPLVPRSSYSIPNNDVAAAAEAEAFCNSPGQPCHKLKRVAAALAEPVANAEAAAWGRRCGLPGEACLKNKRDTAANAGVHSFCWLPGAACSKAKRQLERLEVAFKPI